MTFDEFQSLVRQNTFACGGSTASRAVFDNPNQSTRVMAAAALVLADKGVGWAVENPKAFRREIWKYLGWAARIALLFAPSGVLVTVAGFLIPVIVAILERQFSTGGYVMASIDFSEMADEARQVLKG